MKKIKLLAVSLLTLGAISLASCSTVQGEKGETGDRGPEGPKGDQGQQGVAGQDGSTWLTGSGIPSSSQGNVGDLYLDTETGDVYLKGASGWSLLTSLKGEDGKDGANGTDGSNGQDGVKGDKGDQGEAGEDGKDGASWLTGTGVPSDTLGNVGDLYLDTSTNDVYLKDETGWTLLTNLSGEDGSDGLDGTNGQQGVQGDKGETAWSNTILPSEGGYVVPSKGSAVAGESITFKVYDSNTSDNVVPYSLEVRSKEKVEEIVLDETLEVVLPMVEGGYVVRAIFVEVNSNSGSVGDALNNITDGDNTVYLDGQINLDQSLTVSTKEGQNLVIDGRGATITADDTTLIDLSSAQGDVEIRNVVIEKKVPTAGAPREEVVMLTGNTGKVTFDNVTFKTESNQATNAAIWVDATGSRTDETIIQNCTFENYGPINLYGAGGSTIENVKIINNDFSSYYEWANCITVSSNLKNVEISGNTYNAYSYGTASLVLFHNDILYGGNTSFKAENVVISNNTNISQNVREGDNRDYLISENDQLWDIVSPLIGVDSPYIKVDSLNDQEDPDSTTSTTNEVTIDDTTQLNNAFFNDLISEANNNTYSSTNYIKLPEE